MSRPTIDTANPKGRPLPAGPVDARRSRAAVLRPLAGGAVRFTGGFWAAQQAVNRERALPHGLRMLETAGNLDNLRIAAGRAKGEYRGPYFMDSDVYKWLEAASYDVAREPNASLSAAMPDVIDLVAAAQREDGYVNSYYEVAEPGQRWTNFFRGHELYCAGHLFQAAVAHHRATGETSLLGIAQRFADYLCATFGPAGRLAVPGHPEVETALVELYRETGTRAYLDLAQFFVDHRGRGWLGPGRFNSSAYYQDRVPVRDASELEGHAVRAQYLTAGVADLYLETGERALFESVRRQWDDLVTGKLYITGAIGSRHHAESVGHPYELPNDLAYGETCASIACFMWGWRMLLATGEGRYADVMERTLYNAILSGVSLDAERYFYSNPLSNDGRDEYISRGGPRRHEWHEVACCPPNIMRLVASLAHYTATYDTAGVQIHLYAPARVAGTAGAGPEIALRVDGDYPWDGRIHLTIEEAPGASWRLSLRVPGWAQTAAVRVNGAPAGAVPDAAGYLRLDRAWETGDTVELDLPLAPRLTEAHPWIEPTRGCVAIERGPVVYCIEQADHPGARVPDLEIDPTAPLTADRARGLLGGVTVVRGHGTAVDRGSWENRLYRPYGLDPAPTRRPAELVAIPYYAWANREPGAMRVWIPQAARG